MRITILTGPIKNGKTTKLFGFIKNLKSVSGILSPVVNNQRVLFHIGSKTIRNFESNNESDITIDVGRYRFLKSSFEWGNTMLINDLKQNYNYLIIDEIGKLELKDEGFHQSCEHIWKNKELYSTNLIMVVRDYLVDDVLSKYKIDKNEIEYFE